jgi:hypothetical protein
MPVLNTISRELVFKVVYCGPGLGGKTTNLHQLHRLSRPDRRGPVVSLQTDSERTLFFDFFPLQLGEFRGFSTTFRVYTVPGQVFYQATRRLVLHGADGLCFVADSQPERMEANLESLSDLRALCREHGLPKLPMVMQYNKRDLASALPIEALSRVLNPGGLPEFAVSAVDGQGVVECFRALAKLVLEDVRRSLDHLAPVDLPPGEGRADRRSSTVNPSA